MTPHAYRLGAALVATLLIGCAGPTERAAPVAAAPQVPTLEAALATMRGRGDIVGLVMDMDGTVGARVRAQDDVRILQLMNADTGHWKSIYKWSQSEHVWPLRTDRARGSVLMVSDVGRSRSALVELTTADGREHVLFADVGSGDTAGITPVGLKLSHELNRR